MKSLEKIQGQLECPKHRLIQDEPTRWNTTFYMLERLIEQRKALTAASVELNVPVELSTSNWTLAEKVVTVLQVFEEATREASGHYSSSALVIPLVNSILRSLEITDGDSGVTQMKRGMLVSLQTRYCDMESNKFYCLATILDPRFKLRVFSTAAAAALAKQMLIFEYESCYEDRFEDPPPTKSPRNDESQSQSKSLLWKFCSEIMSEKSDNEELPESMDFVIDTYLKEPNEPCKSNPLEYWKDREHTWPILALMSTKYLCAPPSTVASERLFSTAGNILTETRNRLSADKLEKLLFLNKNLTLLNFEY